MELFHTALQKNQPYEVVITDLGMPQMDGTGMPHKGEYITGYQNNTIFKHDLGKSYGNGQHGGFSADQLDHALVQFIDFPL